MVAILAPAAAAHQFNDDYRWLDVAEPATGRTASMPVGFAADFWTPDFQAVASFDASVLPSGAEVVATLDPVDAALVASIPDGFEAVSNVYTFRLERDGEPVAQLRDSELQLATAIDGQVTVLGSNDGSSWVTLQSSAIEANRVVVDLAGPGFYVVVAEHDHQGVPTSVVLVAPLAVLGGLAAVERLTRSRRGQRRSA